jgi:hypothetical protein
MPELSQPRPLREEERRLIEFLLGAEFSRRDQLRQQLESAQVVWECECGCGTINLRASEGALSAKAAIAVEARGEGIDVSLFVRAGKMSSLEMVDDLDRRPPLFPRPEDLQIWIAPRNVPRD